MTLESNRNVGYENAERRRQQLIAVTDQIATIVDELGLLALADAVAAIATRVRSDAFVVTVLGDFNTGKSTLINALLGADALPRLPVECTAILTEVRWGDQPEALLYRRTGTGAVAAEPEQVKVEQLRDLIVVDVDDPDAQSPYGWAEVHWPIELCRNNVVLVDSPGLNADRLREELTMAYLARTDAVVFVLDARANMKRNEVDFMRSNLDNHDPFFVFNGINHIAENEQELVKRAAAGRLRRVRSEHPTDSANTFWVDALTAVRSRLAGVASGWDESGVADLERRLEAFLTTERHKVKIMVPARTLRLLRKDVARSLAKQTEMLSEGVEELTRRYEDAQVPLERLQHDAASISTELGNRLGDLQDFIQNQVKAQLVDLVGKVPDWAVESVPDSSLSIRPWKTKEQAEAVATEVASLTARQVEAAFAEWVGSTLAPQISARVVSIAADLQQQVTEFEQDLDAIRLDMSGIASSAAGRTEDEESSLARILAGVGGQLLGGPAAGLAGLRFGPREMVKALLPSLAIGLVWLFTPFGFPVLIAGLVAQAIFGSHRSLRGAEKKIKATIGKDMAREMRDRAYENAQLAAKNVGNQLAEFRQAVTQGLDRELLTFRQEVEQVLEAKRSGEQAAEAKRHELVRIGERLDDAMDQLDEIVDDIARI
ncbi:MAG: dynamin family protein [Actinomycetota bacterium]|nr:dynamin family protein [Actinomycetota bacterium]